jgi:hypothetical protein
LEFWVKDIALCVNSADDLRNGARFVADKYRIERVVAPTTTLGWLETFDILVQSIGGTF